MSRPTGKRIGMAITPTENGPLRRSRSDGGYARWSVNSQMGGRPMSKELRGPTTAVERGKRPAPVRVKLRRVNCDHAIPYPPDGQAREWWQRLRNALGTTSSALASGWRDREGASENRRSTPGGAPCPISLSHDGTDATANPNVRCTSGTLRLPSSGTSVPHVTSLQMRR